MPSNHLFYPGCSLEAGGGYLESINTVTKALGIELKELPDWNCCGSTMMKGYHRGKCAVTAARNFSLAKREGAGALVVVCNACLSTLIEQRNNLLEDAALRAQVGEALKAGGHELCLDVEIKHLLDLFIEEVGVDRIAGLVKKPLKEQFYAAYYGCLYTRPARPHIDPDNPDYIGRLLKAMGGQTVDFDAHSYCCGTSQGVTHPPAGHKMSVEIMAYACRKQTDAIVTICPMCNFNLEACVGAESLANPQMGVIFFTQAMGLAFGMSPEELGMGKLFLPPQKILNQVSANP